jgi:hypothetical protein
MNHWKPGIWGESEEAEDPAANAFAEVHLNRHFFDSLGREIRKSARERHPPKYHDEYDL